MLTPVKFLVTSLLILSDNLLKYKPSTTPHERKTFCTFIYKYNVYTFLNTKTIYVKFNNKINIIQKYPILLEIDKIKRMLGKLLEWFQIWWHASDVSSIIRREIWTFFFDHIRVSFSS